MLYGMLTLEEMRARVERGEIETIVLGFTDHYGRLMGKRFDAEFFLANAEDGTHGCNYLLIVDMEMEPTPGYKYANWEMGFGDLHIAPDLSTLRVASWLDKTALVLCDVVDDKAHDYVPVAPRSILRRQIARTAELGYTAMAASELEFFAFDDSYRQAQEKGYTGLQPMGWYIEDYHILQGSREEKFVAEARRHLKRSGIPVENSKGEWGHGQHELNVRYAESLVMADRHAIFKQCLKEVADALGFSVTFMAKPFDTQAGSSGHLHFSLWQDGQNAFKGDKPLGRVAGSDVFRWFLGGWMAHAAEMMVFYAPTINSYKRFIDLSWAPTRIAWSYDNRTAGFRILNSGAGPRIENRIPGADCNPYLAYAASLASGIDGIINRIEPPAMFDGDIYAAQQLPRVPRTLEHAVELFASSTFAKQAFGADVVEHYAHFYTKEVEAYNKAVTDWERARYFERI
ncbi:MAG: glutamine synthetase, type I [Chloroflexi bacterium OLB13]|nr:MAG: glutamine synthetase, type I [Chloroflexi bacterium OLB13]